MMIIIGAEFEGSSYSALINPNYEADILTIKNEEKLYGYYGINNHNEEPYTLWYNDKKELKDVTKGYEENCCYNCNSFNDENYLCSKKSSLCTREDYWFFKNCNQFERKDNL